MEEAKCGEKITETLQETCKDHKVSCRSLLPDTVLPKEAKVFSHSWAGLSISMLVKADAR
jgi:hypothetical protein